jgi:hypothetical protein
VEIVKGGDTTLVPFVMACSGLSECACLCSKRVGRWVSAEVTKRIEDTYNIGISAKVPPSFQESPDSIKQIAHLCKNYNTCFEGPGRYMERTMNASAVAPSIGDKMK